MYLCMLSQQQTSSVCTEHQQYTVISSESPPRPTNLTEMGIKTLSYPRGIFFFFFFKVPPLPLSSPRGVFFRKKKRPPPGGTQKIGRITSVNCQLFAVVVMLVVILGIVAQKVLSLCLLNCFS